MERSKYMNVEPTLSDVMEVIQDFASSVDTRFSQVDAQFAELRADVAVLKTDVAELKTDMSGVKSRMVTKDYLDDKLGDLYSDLVIKMRKEDELVIAKIRKEQH